MSVGNSLNIFTASLLSIRNLIIICTMCSFLQIICVTFSVFGRLLDPWRRNLLRFYNIVSIHTNITEFCLVERITTLA